MMVAKFLHTLAVDMGQRPSEVVKGGHAEASFDAMVMVKAKAE